MSIPPAEQPQRVFVVLNPLAGSCTTDDVYASLDRNLTAAGHSYEAYETTGEEQLADVVRAALARDFTIVAAAGGDGTVSDVAEGLVHSEIPLAIIPVGTANVLARELGVPVDLDGACRLLAGSYEIANIDVMQVGERFYLLQIGIGLDALMIRDTNRESKRRFGSLAYLWTALTQLLGYQPRRFMLVVDGLRVRLRAAQVLIANGGTLGLQPFRWGPDIYPNDGQIDLCIVNAQTIRDYLGIFWHTIIGQQRRSRKLRYLHAREFISVNTRRALPIQADGEIIGTTPIQVRVVPQAVRVIVPPSSAILSTAESDLESAKP